MQPKQFVEVITTALTHPVVALVHAAELVDGGHGVFIRCLSVVDCANRHDWIALKWICFWIVWDVLRNSVVLHEVGRDITNWWRKSG